MPVIGQIVRLQVQRSALKLPSSPGAANGRYYDPAALVQVARLQLTPDGVLGLIDQGDAIVDVHHLRHPASKNVRGTNGMSVGFTAHYELMRDRFGSHLADGIAGENVLVGTDDNIDHERLLGGLDIFLRDGGQVHLDHIIVAEPCVEFTCYALQLGQSVPGGEACAEGLRFLRRGMRGFYVSYAGDPVVLNVGDAVFAPS
ncbi:MAG: hypothetical protein ACR2IK_08330 [Chloroflexota bacterium]